VLVACTSSRIKKLGVARTCGLSGALPGDKDEGTEDCNQKGNDRDASWIVTDAVCHSGIFELRRTVFLKVYIGGHKGAVVQTAAGGLFLPTSWDLHRFFYFSFSG